MGPTSQSQPWNVPPLHMTFNSQKQHLVSFLWGCLMPVCTSLPFQFPSYPSSPRSCSPSSTAAVGAAALAPRQALLSRVCFSHQPLENEAGVTGHWLDNEFILQTHREQGASLAHLFSLHGSGSAVCKERGKRPAELLMCNRARADGPRNTHCKAKKWEETELWDYFTAIAGNASTEKKKIIYIRRKKASRGLKQILLHAHGTGLFLGHLYFL